MLLQTHGPHAAGSCLCRLHQEQDRFRYHGGIFPVFAPQSAQGYMSIIRGRRRFQRAVLTTYNQWIRVPLCMSGCLSGEHTPAFTLFEDTFLVLGECICAARTGSSRERIFGEEFMRVFSNIEGLMMGTIAVACDDICFF